MPHFRTASLAPSELNDVAPTEYRADAVVTLENPDGTAMSVVVEVQLKADPRKRRSWPAYLGTLYARLGRPVALLVVCPQRSVAEWCAEPITIGPPGSVVTPVALGPEQLPVVTDLEVARRLPEFAVLSAIAHSAEPGRPRPAAAGPGPDQLTRTQPRS